MIKVIATSQTGTVMEVHQIGEGYVYGVQLRTKRGRYVRVHEAELELLKPANADETGLHVRHIT
jgi:hypothetical protein